MSRAASSGRNELVQSRPCIVGNYTALISSIGPGKRDSRGGFPVDKLSDAFEDLDLVRSGASSVPTSSGTLREKSIRPSSSLLLAVRSTESSESQMLD